LTPNIESVIRSNELDIIACKNSGNFVKNTADAVKKRKEKLLNFFCSSEDDWHNYI